MTCFWACPMLVYCTHEQLGAAFGTSINLQPLRPRDGPAGTERDSAESPQSRRLYRKQTLTVTRSRCSIEPRETRNRSRARDLAARDQDELENQVLNYHPYVRSDLGRLIRRSRHAVRLEKVLLDPV